ncbi:translation initiation factor IF-2 N-terminal domain-containing protein [Corynebacterium sp. A21]|uniref:translation initiation factor IF-2 N-terminal domain-containing protein n=1 Tax=Corynebacterium sp. A21 TaxID=3457318 RepID=UPI003FD3A05B
MADNALTSGNESEDATQTRRRRSARKATTKPAVVKETETVTPAAAESTATAGAAKAPARKRSTRKTTTKVAPAVKAEASPVDTAPDNSSADNTKAENTAIPEAATKNNPRRSTRRSGAAKTTTAKATTAKAVPAKTTPAKTTLAKTEVAPQESLDISAAAEDKDTQQAPVRRSRKRVPQKLAAEVAPATTEFSTEDVAPDTTSAAPAEIPASAVLAADFDRSQLSPKMRVHALAKLLGMTSKDLISALAEVSVRKVAQSNLSLEESHKLLDALGKPAQEAPGTPDAQPVEKIRQRVEKNVANEIHQIEEKVERELAEVADTTEPSVAESTDLFGAVTQDEDEPLEDMIAEITPPPAAEPAFQPPIFRAANAAEAAAPATTEESGEDEDSEDSAGTASRRRRRGRRGAGRGRGVEDTAQATEATEEAEEAQDAEVAAVPEVEEVVDKPEVEQPEAPVEPLSDEPVALRGSTRLEAQRRRRTELREDSKKKRHIVSQAEFLARRESVERTMVVRERDRHDHPGMVTQVGVLEDDLLVEHFVTSEEQSSLIGNIYLGRVQNVLPSMEAAFIDIGKGRNGVLYAGEVDWKAAGLGGRGRRIEQALRSGDQVLVQVTKDPVGQKGARLTTQISLAGRFLVYVPGGRSAGISRKLPAPERKRLKEILKAVVPGEGGAIIRTAAEGVPEEAIAADVNRLHSLWEDIQERTEQEKNSKGAKPVSMYEEPNMLVKVIRDLFNEDFQRLVVDGNKAWNLVHAYVKSVAPDLLERVVRYHHEDHEGQDAFAHFRIDEQLQKALARKVWLPSGGSLVIDRTEAMTVIDVNTGKFTGSGGNLEETVTRNNLEAAEEIVRQMRLRDIGGMIVVDFIDMVLSENQDLVLRRLTEFLGRDRTRHQVSEVTSLGLVQMTRKRLGTGLLETFSTDCEHCEGRGLILHEDPVEHVEDRPVYGKPAAKQEEAPRGQDALERTRSSVRKRSEPQPAVTPPARSIEDLAAAVVIVDAPEKSAVTSTPEVAPAEEQKLERRSGRGRGRRRPGGRAREDMTEMVTERRVPVDPAPVAQGSALDEDVSDTSDLERIVAAALDLAHQEDPDEPSASDYVSQLPAEQSAPEPIAVEPRAAEGDYDQAVAEFEASPRRRRQTRGNSRSDQRPQPEDFKAPARNSGSTGPSRRRRGGQAGRAGQPVQAESDMKSSQGFNDAPVASADTAATEVKNTSREATVTVEKISPAGGRGRRRVVRRVAVPEVEAAAPESTQSPVKQRVAAQQSAVREDAAGTSRSARGRRRVVRRNTNPVEPPVAQPELSPETPSKEAPSREQESSQRSGAPRRSGRRSTRRSNRG